jgi:hypothetical protein
MANTLKEAMESRRLVLYDDEHNRLRRDFGKLNFVEKSYGLRLEAVSDETGHADIATALVIALPTAIDFLYRQGFSPDDVLADGEKITEAELAEMPDELRDIYESTASRSSNRGTRRRTFNRAADDE